MAPLSDHASSAPWVRTTVGTVGGGCARVLPVVLSIPHGGERTPAEVADRLALTAADRFDDSDAKAIDLYDINSGGDDGIDVCAAATVAAEVARVFVDVNRARDDLPPANPYGVVKTITTYSRPLYTGLGGALDPDTIEALLARYYDPYHDALASVLRSAYAAGSARLCLDCHTMVAAAPDIAPDPVGKPRPAFCLGDREGTAAPRAWTERLAGCLARAFEVDAADVAINRPFGGGHIIRTYAGNPLPAIQIEMSCALYVAPPWFDRAKLTVDVARLRHLRRLFAHALADFFDGLESS